MDFQELLKRYSPFLKSHWLPLALGLLGLILIIYGLIALFGASQSENNVVFEAGSEEKGTLGEITVDIEGAVVRPGVYTLPSDSRIHNLLIKAGGLSSQADREWVAKNLNLALKLTDGAKVYVPEVGESIKSGTPLRPAQRGFAGQASTTGLINLNTASETELDSLPGVGPVTAQKIINGRPYGNIEELLSKKVVSSKVFSQIKERITVY